MARSSLSESGRSGPPTTALDVTRHLCERTVILEAKLKIALAEQVAAREVTSRHWAGSRCLSRASKYTPALHWVVTSSSTGRQRCAIIRDLVISFIAHNAVFDWPHNLAST